MLCSKFELIPIKIDCFTNFQSYKINQAKFPVLYVYYSTGTIAYSTWLLAKFWQKWLGENSLFLLHFLIHIHVLMLCRKFELILIKIGFFYKF